MKQPAHQKEVRYFTDVVNYYHNIFGIDAHMR